MDHQSNNQMPNNSSNTGPPQIIKPKPGKGSRKVILMVIVVAILALMGLGGYSALKSGYFKSSSGCSKNFTKQCALTEAKDLLSPDKSSQLGEVVSKIQKIKNYQQDPDLLYIVTLYHLNNGDAKNAQLYFEMLEKVYDPKVGYDPAISESALSIADLKLFIKFVTSQKAEVERNSFTVQEPQ